MATSPAVSVKDVARRAGVSVGTVSNVLNHPDKVSASTASRVQAAISALGFVRNDAARQLRAGSSHAIGLVVLDVRNPFFGAIAIGAEDFARQSGYTIVLGNSGESSQREASYLDLFEQQRMAGLLISPVGAVEDRLVQLRERGAPSVLVDRPSSSNGFSSVAVDDLTGGRLAGEHLTAIGRRHVAFVGGPLGIRQVHDRLAGLQTALDRVAGTSVTVLEGETLSILEGRRLGEMIAGMPARRRPDAVFAANDLLALGVLQALVMLGTTRIPEDIAIVGYDDIDFARSAVVPLTSIRQPPELIGRTAVEMLLDEAAGREEPGRAVLFQPELIVRNSSDPDAVA